MDYGVADCGHDTADARRQAPLCWRGSRDGARPAHRACPNQRAHRDVPIDHWSRITEKALSFALGMSCDIRCVHVQTSEEPDPICSDWETDVAAPLRAAGKCVPRLDILQSPFRYILAPVVDYILQVERESSFQKVCVLVPELVVHHWWENLLHNRRADMLKIILLLRGNRRIIVINIPWYLERD